MNIENKKVVILYNKIKSNTKDELDVLSQVSKIKESLKNLGYKVYVLKFYENINLVIKKLRKIKPKFVFNLVESFEAKGELIYLAPSILDYLNIKYTGGNVKNIFTTTDKLLTKIYLKNSKINTPEWISLNNISIFSSKKNYIIKPTKEDGSVDITDNSVVFVDKLEHLINILSEKEKETGIEYFAERYIDGREFNISILGNNGKPEILPPAEIEFIDYPFNKFKVLNYNSKWEEDSFEYQNTIRTFEFEKTDDALLEKLIKISKECWRILNLKGYARIDYRIDEEGIPWILEINSNPCLSIDSGFVAAAAKKNYDYDKMIERIIKEV